MSEKSLRTKKNHQQVWDMYCDKLKSYGNLASALTRTRIYADISDLTEYSISSVKQIINTLAKIKTRVCVCF